MYKMYNPIIPVCCIIVSVHLRVREVDQLIPKTLYPPSSAISYWQVETEQSILQGTFVYKHFPT